MQEAGEMENQIDDSWKEFCPEENSSGKEALTLCTFD